MQLLEEKFQPEQGLEPGLAKERAVLPGEGRRVHPVAMKRDKTFQAKTKKNVNQTQFFLEPQIIETLNRCDLIQKRKNGRRKKTSDKRWT